MAGTYRQAIERRLTYLRGHGIDIAVNTNSAGWRVETIDGSRDISPRLTGKEMVDWLNAFETGYDMGKAAGINDMRKGRVDGDLT